MFLAGQHRAAFEAGEAEKPSKKNASFLAKILILLRPFLGIPLKSSF